MLFSLPAFTAILVWLTAFGVAMLILRSPAVLAVGIVFGVLLLPQFNIDLPFLDLNKPILIAFVTVIGVLLVDSAYVPAFRPSLLDLPVLLLCGAGFAASLSNELGVYTGLVFGTQLFCTWGIPFFSGRCIFASQDNALTFLRAVILGALFYVPLCVFEMKMAPVLHGIIYGYAPRGVNDLYMAVRFGFWRPTVFMQMGLELSLFMGISSVLAIWGATSGSIPKVAGLSTKFIGGVLAATTIGCFSSTAIILTVAGWLLVLSAGLKINRLLLTALLLPAIGYPLFRIVNVGAVYINTESKNDEIAARKHSLQTRIASEDVYLTNWKLRPILGCTPSKFWQTGDQAAIPDSLWIIILSCYGLIGWVAWSMHLSAPLLAITGRLSTITSGRHPAVPMVLCVLLFWLDSLLNAFPNILYSVMIGASVGCAGTGDDVRLNSIKHPERIVSRLRTPRRLWPPVV